MSCRPRQLVRTGAIIRYLELVPIIMRDRVSGVVVFLVYGVAQVCRSPPLLANTHLPTGSPNIDTTETLHLANCLSLTKS